MKLIEIVLAIFILLPFVLTLAYYINRAAWLKQPVTYPNKSSQYVTLLGHKIHYAVEISSEVPDAIGNKPKEKILFIHGLAANAHCWRKLTPLLVKHYDCYSIDLVGFGLSDKPENYDYGLTGQSTLVFEFIKKVIGEKCTLVGSSMGGAISLEAAAKHSDLINHLILISPAYDSSAVYFNPIKFLPVSGMFFWLANPWFAKYIVRTIYGTKHDLTNDNVHSYLRPYLNERRATKSLLKAFAAVSDHELKERIKKITTPTLILWGKNDHVTRIKMASYIKLSILNSQLEIHSTGGHHLHEEEAQWVAEKIEKFLS